MSKHQREYKKVNTRHYTQKIENLLIDIDELNEKLQLIKSICEKSSSNNAIKDIQKIKGLI